MFLTVKSNRRIDLHKRPLQETGAGFLFQSALLLFVFIFTRMKNIKCFLLLGVGLLLTAPVGFASDGTKITKDCYFEVGDLAYDVVAYEYTASPMIVVSHNFDYTFVAIETFEAGYVEGPIDIGSNSSNEFGILSYTFIIENRFGKYPVTNDWLRYKNDLNFTLSYKYSKAPKCDYTPTRC